MINGINNYDYFNSSPYSSYGAGGLSENGAGTAPGECKTCGERKYQDGSDEMVSFKSAAHISPNAAPSVVRAHEGEHVANAFSSAVKNDGKVINASVSIHTDICPECGRTYVSGGTTTTQIMYNKDKYAQNAKEMDKSIVIGRNVDERA